MPAPVAPGLVSLVGAGPGHPDHLTLRGARVLAAAEIVVYDALLGDAFRPLFPPGAELHFVGKRAGLHSCSQERICDLLVSAARSGRKVVRLKGGDAGVFGHMSEEVSALVAAGIPYEVVPGVTSVTAAASCAGFPLTMRGISASILIVDGHAQLSDNCDFHPLANHAGTLVVLMASRAVQCLAVGLLAAGAPGSRPLVLVEGATFPDQRAHFATLAEAAAGQVAPATTGPGIIYVGEVARPAHAWALSALQRRLHAA